MVLRLPQFISNTFENDFAAIHHRVSLTNILTESCQRTRRLKTGFLLLLFFISEQIPTPANNKNPNAPPERGVLAARGRPSPRGSAWARPGGGGLARGQAAGPGRGRESPEPGRLGPASRWLCAATCRARWHRHGPAGPRQQLPSGPVWVIRGNRRSPPAGAELHAAASLLLLSVPAHKEAMEQIRTGVACAKHCNAYLIISSDGKRARK